ncbi:D-ribose pyranase [Vespertiliibacter pulmonis]|uniref:D-ribose pyranase n=1 Tax=Vespertiliibacter pulmonis TaxID=1443036 RepID=A0A3N4VPC1_9PAST|nr:D-ribose pyranase [Vespertiliibacter pulmonis]QLB20772.1 D-ribose pyranase [Vespertiliibacter pulmonis]RPE83423.1 ribose transport protein RbsD [Vespertiliibacter pulmonis]
MKKTTLLNAPLSHLIATMGHTDSITICDAGLPIPTSQKCIDLALTQGVPDFLSTLQAVISELFVEKVILAEEIKLNNPQLKQKIIAIIEQLRIEQNKEITLEYISHEQFKQRSAQGKGVVRTGECSPYANVILYSGVPF